MLTIDGEPGFDLALTSLGLLVNESDVDVPALATIGLLGLGLAAVGLRRRRA